ncbi:hypothetical protein WMY93_020115 [Mugilogobius chulae]|uniref:Uncharacterized protein n=1 Tax=Mugilogobius chulae TaxID=88201 RepID=A0AAW0NR46_9GOBI
MSRLERLRSLVSQRINAAADDIGRILEGKVAEFEEEVRFFREENNSLQHKILQLASKSDVQIVVMDDEMAVPGDYLVASSQVASAPVVLAQIDSAQDDPEEDSDSSASASEEEEAKTPQKSEEEEVKTPQKSEEEEVKTPPKLTRGGRQSDAKDSETAGTSSASDTENDKPKTRKKRSGSPSAVQRAKRSKN